MFGFRLSLAAVALCGGVVLAEAASPSPDEEAAIKQQIQTALANIQNARCGTAKFCDAATAEENANPPLNIAEATSAIDRGAISGVAKLCGLDWSRDSYQPLIDYWRQQKKTERQLALLDILHGMALARTEALIGSRPCTDRLRRSVQARFSKLP